MPKTSQIILAGLLGVLEFLEFLTEPPIIAFGLLFTLYGFCTR